MSPCISHITSVNACNTQIPCWVVNRNGLKKETVHPFPFHQGIEHEVSQNEISHVYKHLYINVFVYEGNEANHSIYFANLECSFLSQHCILGSLLIIKSRMLCLDSRKTCPHCFFKDIAKDLVPEATKGTLKGSDANGIHT